VGLLSDIQMDAINESVEISNLLRKCMILAYKLDHQPFKNWVEHELNGYPNDAELPEYRLIHTESYGNFYGPFGSSRTNWPIPPAALPVNYRDMATHVALRAGIANFADFINQKEIIRFAWDSNAVAYIQNDLIPQMILGQAWRAVSPGIIRGMFDAVKNRILVLQL
jgi:hypothetical protein